ncbi:MAG: ABC transporter ATP-binding protein [bacterium]|nr:ABC transporter ATP-binding protein [bacterium]
MGAVLQTREVVKEYRGGGEVVRALSGISLTVEPGRFLAIMGASGSGKTTLLHLMGGLDVPTSGQVLVEGQDIAAMSDRGRTLFRRRRVGVIFQAFNLLPTLSAEENVALPLLVDGRDRADYEPKVNELLEQVDLVHRRSHRPQALSGGEQQRVAIARALVNDPVIVLADEPTGNLDSRHGEEIWKLLCKLASERDCTVIAVTHEAAGAAHADRVVVLKDGVAVGEIESGGQADATLVAASYAKLAG